MTYRFHGLPLCLGALAVSALTACVGPIAPPADKYQPCGDTETIRTGWLSETDYLKAAADQRACGCYPVSLKGEAVTGGGPRRLYRAAFIRHPDNIVDWRASLGLGPAADADLDAMLTAEGYVRVWHDDLTDLSGAHYLQGIWTKRGRWTGME